MPSYGLDEVWRDHEKYLERERLLSREAGRLGLFFRTLGTGMVNRYPMCCILRFSLCEVRRRNAPQAVERGGINDRPCGAFVACGIFHRGTWKGEKR